MKLYTYAILSILALFNTVSCGKQEVSKRKPRAVLDLGETDLKIATGSDLESLDLTNDENANEVSNPQGTKSAKRVFVFSIENTSTLAIAAEETDVEGCSSSESPSITYFIKKDADDNDSVLGVELEEKDHRLQATDLEAADYKLVVYIHNPHKCIVNHLFASTLEGSNGEPAPNPHPTVAPDLRNSPAVKSLVNAGIEVESELTREELRPALENLEQIEGDIVSRAAVIQKVVLVKGYFEYLQNPDKRVLKLNGLARPRAVAEYLSAIDSLLKYQNEQLQGIRIHMVVTGNAPADELQDNMKAIKTNQARWVSLRPFVDVIDLVGPKSTYDSSTRTVRFSLEEEKELREEIFEIAQLEGSLYNDTAIKVKDNTATSTRQYFLNGLRLINQKRDELISARQMFDQILIEKITTDGARQSGYRADTRELFFVPSFFTEERFTYFMESLRVQADLQNALGLKILPAEGLEAYYYSQTMHMFADVKDLLLAKRGLYDRLYISTTTTLASDRALHLEPYRRPAPGGEDPRERLKNFLQSL
jgi:hypothetical protein